MLVRGRRATDRACATSIGRHRWRHLPVAPLSGDLGVMLPYTPLHHLLLCDVGATLVMTSANVSDEPIAYEDEDALARLAAIADLFLLHDRPIHMRTDEGSGGCARGAGGPPLLDADACARLRARQHRPAVRRARGSCWRSGRS